MTNKEAILRIEDHIRVHHIGEYPHIHIAEALNMAIEALKEIEIVKKERDKAVEMVRAMSHQFGTCDGCKQLGSKCSVSDYWCEKDGQDRWEWEGLDEKSN